MIVYGQNFCPFMPELSACHMILWGFIILPYYYLLKKNMTISGWGIFALYGYSENLKNLLLGIYSSDFSEILLGFSLEDYQSPSPHFDSCKTWLPVGGAFLPYKAVVQTSKIFFLESMQGISMKVYRHVL